MAKKKVVKKAAKKKVVKKAAAVVAPPPPEPDVRGDCGKMSYEWYDGERRFVASSGTNPFSFCVDFGRPLASVDAELNGDAVVPKMDGSCVYLRCAGGALVMNVNYSDPPEPCLVVSDWR